MSSVVYFVSGSDQQIKIGTTYDFTQRLKALQVEYGDLKLLAACPGGFPRERELHQEFDDARVQGEWFYPTDRLMAKMDAIVKEFGDPQKLVDSCASRRMVTVRLQKPYYDTLQAMAAASSRRKVFFKNSASDVATRLVCSGIEAWRRRRAK